MKRKPRTVKEAARAALKQLEASAIKEQAIDTRYKEALSSIAFVTRQLSDLNCGLMNENRDLRHEVRAAHSESLEVLRNSIEIATNYQGISANLRWQECRTWDLEQKVKEKEEVIKNLSLKGKRRGPQ